MNPAAAAAAAPVLLNIAIDAVKRLREAFPRDPERVLAKLKVRLAKVAAKVDILAATKPGSDAHLDAAAREAGLNAMIAAMEAT
jgi:hypothetical protein